MVESLVKHENILLTHVYSDFSESLCFSMRMSRTMPLAGHCSSVPNYFHSGNQTEGTNAIIHTCNIQQREIYIHSILIFKILIEVTITTFDLSLVKETDMNKENVDGI